jgi:hypothetical protein
MTETLLDDLGQPQRVNLMGALRTARYSTPRVASEGRRALVAFRRVSGTRGAVAWMPI